MAAKKSLADFQDILSQIQFLDRKFTVQQKGDGFLLQLSYIEKDIYTDKPSVQKSRKWYLTAFATESEIVDTAYAACVRSMRHVTKEHFLYQNRRVFSPHFDIKARIDLCDNHRFDDPERINPHLTSESPKTVREPGLTSSNKAKTLSNSSEGAKEPDTLRCTDCQEQVSIGRDVSPDFCHRCGGHFSRSAAEALECYF